jgi:hypothetical protein
MVNMRFGLARHISKGSLESSFRGQISLVLADIRTFNTRLLYLIYMGDIKSPFRNGHGYSDLDRGWYAVFFPV